MPTLARQLNLADAQPDRFFGWWVVAGCFAMASVCWGLAFYGNGVYLAHLTNDRGWPIATVSNAFTLFYWLGALLIVATGRLVDRIGPHRSAAVGALALALAVILIAHVPSIEQFYFAMCLMALGWAWMSGAAINTTIARWFDRKRGLALSVALTGASMGGMLVVLLMVWSIGRFGYSNGLSLIAVVLTGVVLLLIALCFVREPAQLGQFVDEARPPHGARLPDHLPTVAPLVEEPWPLRRLLTMRAFVTTALAFSVALLAQVGLLTHQITMIQELLTREVATTAVAITSISAVLGRLAAGALADTVPRRRLAALNFAIQLIGLLLYAWAGSASMVYLACVFYGLGVGNLIALPGLLAQHEFPPAQFAHVTRWLTAITQASYALGPALLGSIREHSGSYFAVLMFCCGLLLISSALIWFGRPAPIGHGQS